MIPKRDILETRSKLGVSYSQRRTRQVMRKYEGPPPPCPIIDHPPSTDDKPPLPTTPTRTLARFWLSRQGGGQGPGPPMSPKITLEI